MTETILKLITKKEDLNLLSCAWKEGKIKLNISKISRELKVDRKTVKKYLKGELPKIIRKKKKYLDDFRERIVNLLNDDLRSFDYIDHLYRYMKREFNITCCRSTFNRYIRKDKELNKLFKSNHTDTFTVRFETKPGQQIQFDLKERVSLITKTGENHVVYIPTLTFGWSRYNYRKIVLDTKTETLIDFLAKAFEDIGGVPDEIVIDNLKAFVEKARYCNNSAILNLKFEEFCKDYGIKVKPCVARRPQTKGKTETQNKIVDQLKNYNGYYADLDDIHEKLEIINKEDNSSVSQATKLPRIFMFSKEKGELNHLPSKEIMEKYHLNLNEVHVSNESLISYKSNKYSVPKKYIDKKVGLKVIKNELHIYYNNKIITVHEISDKLLNIKPEHNLVYKIVDIDNTDNGQKQITNELENIIYD